MSPEEFCAFAHEQITPGPSPFADPKLAWRRPAAVLKSLAPLVREPWNEFRYSIYAQIGAGNLFAPIPGSLALHDPAADWNPFAGVQDEPTASQRKLIAARLEAVVSQPRLPCDHIKVGRSNSARLVVAQRSLKLPHALDNLAIQKTCFANFERTANPAALSRFLLRPKVFQDSDCREIADDLFELYGVSTQARETFFAAHESDPYAAHDELFLEMDLRRASRNLRWPLYRGLPKKIRERLERRQFELIFIERRRAGLPP